MPKAQEQEEERKEGSQEAKDTEVHNMWRDTKPQNYKRCGVPQSWHQSLLDSENEEISVLFIHRPPRPRRVPGAAVGPSGLQGSVTK